MPDLINALYNMRYLEDIAHKNTIIHKIHPLIKLLTTLLYIVLIASFDKYEVTGLLPFIFYPVIIINVAGIPLKILVKRLLFIEPLIIGIAILNPLFDTRPILIYGISITGGWIVFISIFIKSTLGVLSAIILIATTGMDNIAFALRILRIPKIFVLQILLTYRYISVLTGEIARTVTAYSLKSFGHKGIKAKEWGSFLGQLLLRTFDRAERVYEAMCLRGFDGEYITGARNKPKAVDFIFLAAWIIFFIISRIINIPLFIGNLIKGAI